MVRRRIVLLLPLMPLLCGITLAQDRSGIDQLFHDIHLAQFVRRMRFTETQLEALLKISKSMDAERQKHFGKRDTPELRRTLGQLRTAILEEAPEEQIDMLFQRVRELSGNESDEGNAKTLFLLASRAGARDALKTLTPAQIARLIGEDEGDPAENLLNVIRKARGGQGEPPEITMEFPGHLARLVSGGDVKKEQDLRGQLMDLASRAVRMTKEEFNKQEKPLLEEARRLIIGAAGSPVNLLQLMAEGRMMEFMTNPRLTSTLEARLNFLKGK